MQKDKDINNKKNNTEEEAGKEKSEKKAAAEDKAEKSTGKPKKETGHEKEEKEKKPEKKAEKEEISETEKLKKELEEKKDQLLRVAAEYDNFRKRSKREKDSLFVDVKADVMKEVLPILDNLERAANNTECSFEDYRKGIEMTLKQASEIFTKLGAESFAEVGDKFDPMMHSAVMHIEDESLDENVIAEVFQKGYKIGDKILRHAMVKVAN